jgi:hypothetical protein
MYLYYETQTLLELDMSQYRTCVCVGLRHDTDTYNYIELYHFFILLLVSMCQCLVSMFVLYSIYIFNLFVKFNYFYLLSITNLVGRKL